MPHNRTCFWLRERHQWGFVLTNLSCWKRDSPIGKYQIPIKVKLFRLSIYFSSFHHRVFLCEQLLSSSSVVLTQKNVRMKEKEYSLKYIDTAWQIRSWNLITSRGQLHWLLIYDGGKTGKTKIKKFFPLYFTIFRSDNNNKKISCLMSHHNIKNWN